MLKTARRFVGLAANRLGYKVERIRPNHNKLAFAKIPGWFSHAEAELLYLLGVMARGRILEVGHFLGRSTAVLCEAIRDSGQPVEFNSFDLGFSTPEEFVAAYRRVYANTNVEVPTELNEMVFAEKSATTSIAKRNLAALELDAYVSLHAADFSALDHGQYDLIFCDAMHDIQEICVNLPEVVKCSKPVCTWAFHDMNETNLDAVLSRVDVKPIALKDTLGVFQFVAVGRNRQS